MTSSDTGLGGKGKTDGLTGSAGGRGGVSPGLSRLSAAAAERETERERETDETTLIQLHN